MKTHHILQVGPGAPRLNSRLSAEYSAHPLWQEPDPQDFLTTKGADFTAAVTVGRFGLTKDQILALPGLEAIAHLGVGYDSIDIDAANARGIQISNTPNVLNDCVADLAVGLIIATARNFITADRFVRAGKWALQQPFPLGRKVTGKKVGIVGLGRIGTDIARRLQGFDTDIRYHNRRPVPDSPYQWVDSVDVLAEWSDFLVLACPGGPATHHIIGRSALEALGPTGTLINVSRGTVVDESELVLALEEGRLGAAGLDVFDKEPTVSESLPHMPNVVLLPHIGSATIETRRDMEDLVIANLARYLKTGTLLTPVHQ